MSSPASYPLAFVAALINHLLRAEPWARRQLQPHVGKVAHLVADPLALRLCVDTEGYVSGVDAAAEQVRADVTVKLPLASLPRLISAAGGLSSAAAAAGLHIEGDAEFAQAISLVASNLRWDAEEDLARLFGDVAATRIAAGFHAVVREAGAARSKFAGNVSEYLLDENPQLVRTRAIDEFEEALRRLRDDLARLEKRVVRLEGT